MSMSWRETKGKKVICKDGVYFSLNNDDEINELRRILDDMHGNGRELYLEDARKAKAA